MNFFLPSSWAYQGSSSQLLSRARRAAPNTSPHPLLLHWRSTIGRLELGVDVYSAMAGAPTWAGIGRRRRGVGVSSGDRGSSLAVGSRGGGGRAGQVGTWVSRNTTIPPAGDSATNTTAVLVRAGSPVPRVYTRIIARVTRHQRSDLWLWLGLAM